MRSKVIHAAREANYSVLEKIVAVITAEALVGRQVNV